MKEIINDEWYRLAIDGPCHIDGEVHFAINIITGRPLSNLEMDNLKVAVRDFMDAIKEEKA